MKDSAERPWKIRDTRTLLKNPYFAVMQQEVIVNDGSTRDYYTLDFPRPAIGVVAVRGGEVLMIRQYRFIVDSYVWAIPSGGVNEGETMEDAASRELHEETGHRARSFMPWMNCYASYGCSNQRFEIFYTDSIISDENGSIDRNEVLSTKWFSTRELLDLIATNGIVDNLSLSPLLLYLLRVKNGAS